MDTHWVPGERGPPTRVELHSRFHPHLKSNPTSLHVRYPRNSSAFSPLSKVYLAARSLAARRILMPPCPSKRPTSSRFMTSDRGVSATPTVSEERHKDRAAELAPQAHSVLPRRPPDPHEDREGAGHGRDEGLAHWARRQGLAGERGADHPRASLLRAWPVWHRLVSVVVPTNSPGNARPYLPRDPPWSTRCVLVDDSCSAFCREHRPGVRI